MNDDNKNYVYEARPRKEFKKKYVAIPLFFILVVILLKMTLVIIDSGEIGVPILFGKALEYNLSEGINMVVPFVKVVKYPIRIQEYTMSAALQEGKIDEDDSITVKTQDGLNVGLDMTIWYYLDKTKSFSIYREIAKRYEDIEPIILRPLTRTILRDVAVNFKVEDFYTEKREDFVAIVSKRLSEIMKTKHLILDRVLIRKAILPQSVEEAIALKMQTKQKSEEMEYRKEIAQKEAEIKQIEAEGLSKAQEIINSTLTPSYIQFKAIEIYKELVDSKNTTFIVMPTSSKGAGMPLILNAESSDEP